MEFSEWKLKIQNLAVLTRQYSQEKKLALATGKAQSVSTEFPLLSVQTCINFLMKSIFPVTFKLWWGHLEGEIS